jgi:hypothetical protein
MFTVMFAIDVYRVDSQWKEMREKKSLLEDQGKYIRTPLRDLKQ